MNLKVIFSLISIFIANIFYGQLIVPQANSSTHVNNFTTHESSEKWALESFGDWDQSREDKSLRDENSKHFKNADGSYTAIVAAGALNYFENGRWKTIFHSIETSGLGFSNIHNNCKTYFPESSTGPLKTVLQDGIEVTEMINMRMFFEGNNSEIQPMSIQAIQGITNFNKLNYPGVYGSGIDLRFTQNTTQRKMDYILANKESLGEIPTGAEWLVFEEQVELPIGWTATQIGNEIHVTDINDQLRMIYESPVYNDSPVHTHAEELAGEVDHSTCSAAHNGHFLTGSYVLTQSGNQLTIATRVPLSWLLDSERTYPCVIDPSVNCYPNVTARWTGHHITTSTNSSAAEGSANYTSTNITSSVDNQIRLGRTGTYGVMYSWMKFNISTVPDNACISSASINYNIDYNYSNSPPDCSIPVRARHLSTDPSVAFSGVNDQARLADIRDGDIYQDQNFALGPVSAGSYVSNTLVNFLSNLTSQLPADWFAVGLHTYAGGTHTSCYFDASGYNNANKPYLTVTYRTLAVDAGVDQSICSGQSITLNGSVPAVPSNTTIFSDDFESYGNVIPLPTSGATWKTSVVTTSTWSWQIENACSPAGGSRCLNMTDGYGVDCDYAWDDTGNKIAWYGTLIDASMHTTLKLNFKWKAYGEPTFDYGKIVYSLDGVNWMDVNATQYSGQSTWQTVSNLNISILDGQQFYIGFRWLNDSNTGTAPGLTIDDVSITGTPVTLSYSWSGGPIVSGSTTLTPVVNPTSTTNYTLTVNFGACSYTDQLALTVLPAASPPTSISATHPTHPAYCHGNTINLSSVGGTAAGSGIVDVWYENSCNTAVQETWSTTPDGRAGWWLGSTTVNSATGILNVTSTGVDPMIYMGGLSINPNIYRYIQVRYRYVSGPTNSGMQVFFENGSGLAESRSQRGTMVMDGSWHYLNLDMSVNYSGVNSGWVGGPTVTGLRFDFCENTGMVMEFDFFLVSQDRMVSDQTALSIAPSSPYYPTVSTQYFTRKIDNCGATTCTSTNVNLPPLGTTLSLDNESATCIVYANETIKYYHSSGRYITSVTAAGSNLGSTIATSYVEPGYLIVPACDMPSLDLAVMQRHWVITPTTNGPATVRLPYYTSELANLGVGSLVSTSAFDLIVSPINTNVLLSKYSGGAFPAVTNVNDNPFDNCTVGGTILYNNVGVGATNPVASINAMYSDFTIPGFSEFWLHGPSNSSPLPVTLSSFLANCNEAKDAVNVEWTTASENNSSHFTVERSIDGTSWEVLGSTAAAGNSTLNLTYVMTDDNVRGHDVMYYRLSQFDNDGSFEIVGLTSADCLNGQNGFELFPNPAGTEVTILLEGSDFSQENTVVVFYDINGKDLQTIKYSESVGNIMHVDLRAFEPGVYIVRLINGDLNDQFVRLIKN